MSDGLSLKVNDRKLRRELKRFGKKAEDGRKPLGQFYEWWKLTVSRAWNEMNVATGGRFRGVRKWAPMKPQYTRKDGTVVPPWGGVAKAKSVEVTRNGKTFTRRLKARGKVKGRLRVGRQVRVRKSDVLNADTKSLMDTILSARPRIIQRRILRIGKGLRAYANYVFIVLKRNPLFWKLPEDRNALTKAGRWYLGKLIKEYNRRG